MKKYNTWIVTMIWKFKRKSLLEKIITYNTLQEKVSPGPATVSNMLVPLFNGGRSV